MTMQATIQRPTFTVADGDAPVDLLVSAAITKHDNTVNQALPGITKAGPGVMAVSGTNTYAGSTLVSAGTLLVNGTHNGGGAYSVSSAATLGGTGTINASVTVDVDGILAPGAGVGTLNIGGATTLNGVLRTELQKSSSDLLNVTGTNLLDISSPTSTADFNILSPLTKTTFAVAHFGTLVGSAFGSITGNLPAGATLDYGVATPNQITLTVPAKSLLGNFDLNNVVDTNDIPAMLQRAERFVGLQVVEQFIGRRLGDLGRFRSFRHTDEPRHSRNARLHRQPGSRRRQYRGGSRAGRHRTIFAGHFLRRNCRHPSVSALQSEILNSPGAVGGGQSPKISPPPTAALRGVDSDLRLSCCGDGFRASMRAAYERNVPCFIEK